MSLHVNVDFSNIDCRRHVLARTRGKRNTKNRIRQISTAVALRVIRQAQKEVNNIIQKLSRLW